MEQVSVAVFAHRLGGGDHSLGLAPEATRFPFDGPAREFCAREYQLAGDDAGTGEGIVAMFEPVEDGKQECESAGLVWGRLQSA